MDKEFKTFVQNRLIEIRSKVEPSKWLYCNTEQNPADIITRVNVKNLDNEMWLNGPAFLYEDCDLSVPACHVEVCLSY